MRDQGIWSVGLGRWNGVQLRIHMFLLIFAAVTLYVCVSDVNSDTSPGADIWLGPACLAVLLASVMFHELGHVVVGSRLGANPIEEVVLGPLGGLGPPPTGLEPQSELVAVTAGPLANLGVCFVTALSLALYGGVDLLSLMNPIDPTGIHGGEPVVRALKITFWVNWLLILVNLIPAFPFDGGRALRAGLLMLNPNLDAVKSVVVVARVAKLTAVGLLLMAWLTAGGQYPLQLWFPLVLLAIFVYFSAKKEEVMAHHGSSDDAFLGYDFSAGYTSLEQSGPRTTTKQATGPLVRWWKRRREMRAQRRRELELVEDGRVDQILSQVHETGLDSLSSEDRDLLKRVSARYRSRPR